MAQYIDKDALVAEIKRLDALYHTSKDLSGDLFIQGLFCFIDTIEVKEVQEELKPQFKVGDTIRSKHWHTAIHKITSIDNKAYHLDNGGKVDISSQQLWELVEESVSGELEEAAIDVCSRVLKGETITIDGYEYVVLSDAEECFKAGAKWQKNHLWKPADGDDLPIIDREVIALLDNDFGHYKVVYAHRPNPNGWNGINIDTGEKEHFEPEIYDKGGWNQPHVLYWLDAKLPYEENKIDKEKTL